MGLQAKILAWDSADAIAELLDRQDKGPTWVWEVTGSYGGL